MKLRALFVIVFAMLVISICAAVNADPIELKRDITYKQQDGYVEILKGEQVVAKYVYKDVAKPYLYPVYAPNGEMVTRNPGEDKSACRSFWVGYGDVNGIDFWNEGEKAGKITQYSIDFESLTPGHWNIHTTNTWDGPENKRIAGEERRYSFLSCEYGTLISTSITIKAGMDVKFADSRDGFLAVCVAQGMQFIGGKGHILNSDGKKDLDCLGKRARWCDYTGEVNGKTCGITIFDTPSNFGYPTYWNVTDYGLLSANPFGGQSYTNDEKNNSSLNLATGESKTFVYVALIHDGKIEAEKLNMIANEIVGRKSKQPQSGTWVQPK